MAEMSKPITEINDPENRLMPKKINALNDLLFPLQSNN